MKPHSLISKGREYSRLFEPSFMRRMVLGQLISIFLFGLVISANLLWQFNKDGDGEYDKGLQFDARMISAVLEDASLSLNITDRLAILSQTNNLGYQIQTQLAADESGRKSQPAFSATRYFDANGKEIFRSTHFPKALLDLPVNQKVTVIDNSLKWNAFSYKSPNQNTTVQVARTAVEFETELLPIIKRFILQPLLWLIPLTTLLTILLVAKGLQPLIELANTISTRTANDLRPIESRSIYAETKPLVSELDSLLSRLNATLKRERNFLADAAHELRTPLAVIQVQADVLSNSENLAEKTEASNELRLGIERTAVLINKLLMMAKVDPDNFTAQFKPIELSGFVQERVASIAPLALKKNIDVEMVAVSEHMVSIDPESFVSAVDNVLDNAIRYTPAGEKLRISVHPINTSWAALTVSDSGGGIPLEHRLNVFERFFRVPGTEQSGSGLGLAIVRQVMALHQGEVTLSTGLEGRGLSVCLKLPSSA